jgi:hypothetical protein
MLFSTPIRWQPATTVPLITLPTMSTASTRPISANATTNGSMTAPLPVASDSWLSQESEPATAPRGSAAETSVMSSHTGPGPVRLTVDVPRRPPAVIEAVAYFVVSEGLTNITKHAQASQAEVVVQRAGDRLHVIISDDGVGGADPAHGTGLAKRAASVDGTFEIVSPPGGPTLLTVDLPCAR